MHAPDTPDFDDLTFSEADKDNLALAAKPNLITRALNGDAEAMAQIEKLHVTKWEVRR